MYFFYCFWNQNCTLVYSCSYIKSWLNWLNWEPFVCRCGFYLLHWGTDGGRWRRWRGGGTPHRAGLWNGFRFRSHVSSTWSKVCGLPCLPNLVYFCSWSVFHGVTSLACGVQFCFYLPPFSLLPPSVQSHRRSTGRRWTMESQNHINLRIRILEDSKIKSLSVNGEFKPAQMSRKKISKAAS